MREMFALEQAHKDADETAKRAKRELEDARFALADRMQAEGVDGTKLDGRSVMLRKDLHASFRTGDMTDEDVRSLLTLHGLEYLIKPTVHAGSFKAAIREIVNETRENAPDDATLQDALAAIPEGLRPFVHVYESTRAMSRKA